MDIRNYLKQSSLYNVLVVNYLVSTRKREKIIRITSNVILYSLLVMILYYLIKDTTKFAIYQKFVANIIPRVVGLLIFNLGLFLTAKLIDIYLSSQYFFEHIVNNTYENDELYTFSAGKILYAGKKTDILHGLFNARIGQRLLMRLGISEKDSKNFIKSQIPLKEENVPDQSNNVLKLKDVVLYLYEKNEPFRTFLNQKGITDKTLFGALGWVIFEIESKEYRSQWWRPEALAQIKNIASDWSFGRTFLLDKYGRDLMLDEQVYSGAFVMSDREIEIGQIETILSKSNSANVLLIGEPGQEKIQVIWSLCRQIKNGKVSASLQKKKPILLMVNSLVSVCKDKETLEEQFLKIISEVALAGNVLLIIDNFTLLLNVAKQLGTDISSLLEHYVLNVNIQMIAIANTEEYHKIIEPDKILMNGLEIVKVRALSTDENIKIISGSSILIENRYGIVFTYQAIQELAESAEYYFPEGVSQDKAIDLLNEIAPWSRRHNVIYITKDTVLEYIQQKTNIPTSGKISPAEKEKLINLEKLIGEKVIGQKEAISGISNTIRRARSGIRNANRPMGSFLFFGPTGVGKTETAKALSEVFFGSEKNMMRLDMSEFQTDDAMERLIGSFDTEKPGILSSMIRDNQYGVVLLDEFEKTNKEVQNLFLQILDEGFFSDTNGIKVSAKNIIFIATSNAGADTIFKMVSDGKNPNEAKEIIIADIISRGLFKPELLNRFDGAIIFHPLEQEDLRKIANLMLKKISKILLEKGIDMKVNNDLVNYVVTNGSNRAFGARPMNRFIQDNIEAEIANLLINKKISSGQSLDFKIENNILISIIK